MHTSMDGLGLFIGKDGVLRRISLWNCSFPVVLSDCMSGNWARLSRVEFCVCKSGLMD